MSGFMIDSGATLMCPHGGQVSIIAANVNVQAGSPLAVQSDTMTIVGCPFRSWRGCQSLCPGTVGGSRYPRQAGRCADSLAGQHRTLSGGHRRTPG